MTQHTPGPCPICKLTRTGYDDPLHERCTRLIAAAPEMLELLKDLVFYDSHPNPITEAHTQDAYKNARALLARIEGTL